jgi:hypothetical protein
LRAAEEKYGDELVVLFVDEQERAPEVEAFAARYGLESVFAMDFTGEVGAQYQLISTPTTYFVDPNGVIQNIHAGVITLDWIDSRLASIRQ